MAGQDISVTKIRGRPRSEPTGVVRLPLSVFEKVDAWIAAQPDPKPSRPEAIRRFVDKALARFKPKP
jgi:hypothetical protein